MGRGACYVARIFHLGRGQKYYQGARVYQGGHAPGQEFTRGGMPRARVYQGGMPRGKGLPGGACHGARDFTRGGIAPGQGFLPGGALPPYAPPVATSLCLSVLLTLLLRLVLDTIWWCFNPFISQNTFPSVYA